MSLEVNGELINAVVEKLESDPVTGLISGRVYYNTTSNVMRIYQGSAWETYKSPTTTLGDIIYRGASVDTRLPIGANGQFLSITAGLPAWEDSTGGSGNGEKNYITNSSALTAITGWNAVGDLTVNRATTAAVLPREFTTGTGIEILADADVQSAADYVYYDFTLDDVDLNKKLKIQWAQKPTGAYADGQLEVVITTQADRTVAVATPDVSSIGNYTGVFSASFDTASTATLSLVIRATTDMSNNHGIVISDVIVGPGQIVNAAASGYLGAISGITAVNNGAKVFTIIAKGWRRDNALILKYSAYGNSTASGDATGDTFGLQLPSGYTIDASALPNSSVISSGENTLGFVQTYGFLTSTTRDRLTRAIPVTTTRIQFIKEGTGTVYKDADLNISNEVYFDGEMVIPIAEWAGAPNYAGSNDVEYASNNGPTWDATNTADFTTNVYGPQGSLTGGTLTGTRDKYVRFQTAIQPTDVLELEFGTNAGTQFFPLSTIPIAGVEVIPITRQNTTIYGAAIGVAVSSTDVSVRFGQYRFSAGATFGAAGDNWPATLRWRVKKTRAGAATGFSLAEKTRSGLAPSGVFNAGESGNLALQEKATTPANPTASDEAKIYLKAGKLILQFNDAGTVRYKYLDLTGTGVTWVHTTTAP